jgi:hypothetical protein
MLRVYILSVTRYHSPLMCKDRHIFRDPSLSRKLSQFFKNIPLSLLRKIERIAFAEYIFLSEELKNPTVPTAASRRHTALPGTTLLLSGSRCTRYYISTIFVYFYLLSISLKMK